MKKFIYFVQYHPTLFLLEKESNYHFMPCRAMQELGYEVEIVSYWKELKIEDDPNFDPRFKLTYVEWIFQALVYMWKNSKDAIVYVNTFIIPSLLMWLVTKKSIFFWHESVFATEYSDHYKIKRFIVKLFYPFFTKIRVINEHDKNLLEKEWFKNKWIVVPLVVSKKNLVEEISVKNDILMLWHVLPKKWPETMLKALKIVLAKYPDIKVHQVWKIDEFISSRWMTFEEELKENYPKVKIYLIYFIDTEDKRITIDKLYENKQLSNQKARDRLKNILVEKSIQEQKNKKMIKGITKPVNDINFVF